MIILAFVLGFILGITALLAILGLGGRYYEPRKNPYSTLRKID